MLLFALLYISKCIQITIKAFFMFNICFVIFQYDRCMTYSYRCLFSWSQIIGLCFRMSLRACVRNDEPYCIIL